MHVRSVVVDPSETTAWPAVQVVLLMHTVAELASLSQVPVAHVVQAEAPAALYEPAAQLVQVAALLVALKVPAVQGAQARSFVVEPSSETRFPAKHVVLAAQAVDGSAS